MDKKMGRYSKLLQGKGKSITIGGDELEIKPLSGKYIGLFMDMNSGNNQEVMLELIIKSLQTADPTITKEDVEELPLNIITNIMEVIMEVNELQ